MKRAPTPYAMGVTGTASANAASSAMRVQYVHSKGHGFITLPSVKIGVHVPAARDWESLGVPEAKLSESNSKAGLKEQKRRSGPCSLVLSKKFQEQVGQSAAHVAGFLSLVRAAARGCFAPDGYPGVFGRGRRPRA